LLVICTFDKDAFQFDFSGTIEKVGRDLQILKELGVEHMVLSYHFVPERLDMEEIINISMWVTIITTRIDNIVIIKPAL
jgi:hypothetical protein